MSPAMHYLCTLAAPDVKSLLTPQWATAGVSVRWPSAELGVQEAQAAQLP